MKKNKNIVILLSVIVLAILTITAICNTLNTLPAPASSAVGSSGSTSSKINSIDTTEPIPPTNQDTLTKPETVAALEQAKTQNDDTVAWLCITGTDIDNPIMQTTNNSDYLTLNEMGSYDGWGSYFADYYANLTTPDTLIQNTVIYGHAENPENPDGQKFSQLFRYTDLEFTKENPYLYLTVEDKTLAFEIFATFYTGIDFYYINPYPSNDDFDTFISTVQAKNEYLFPDITVTEQDKILTLSTCSHKYDTANTRNQRLVIMAKLVDTTSDATPNILPNPSPERP